MDGVRSTACRHFQFIQACIWQMKRKHMANEKCTCMQVVIGQVITSKTAKSFSTFHFLIFFRMKWAENIVGSNLETRTPQGR